MSGHYGYGERPDNPSVHELARKKKQQEAESWRDVTNKIWDSSKIFRQMSSTHKESEIPSSLRDITVEQAKERGLSETERIRRNRDFEVRRRQILGNNKSRRFS